MDSVLFISLMNSTAWGGSEEIWYKSALHLAGKNQNVGVCCFNWEGKEERNDMVMKWKVRQRTERVKCEDRGGGGE